MVTNYINKKRCSCGRSKVTGELACQKCAPVLEDYVFWRMKFGSIDSKDIYRFFEEHGFWKVGICIICGGNYILGGHNPYPVVDDDYSRCCLRCNYEMVMLTRISQFA